MKRILTLTSSIVLGGFSALAGQILTWAGGETGNFSDAGAWVTDAGVAATPAGGDELHLTGACEVVMAQTDIDVITNSASRIVIGENAKLNLKEMAKSKNVDVRAVLSGAGTFAVTDSGAAWTWVRFRADNSAFTGSFDFQGSFICLDHAKGLGLACPVTAVGPTSSQTWFFLVGIDGAVLANPMTITSKNNFTFGNYGCRVTFSGAMTFNGFTRFMCASDYKNTQYVFTGPITVNGILDPYLKPFDTHNNLITFSPTSALNMNLNDFGLDGGRTRTVFNCPVTGFADGSTIKYLQVKDGMEYVINADILGSDAAGFAVNFEQGMIDISGHTVQIGNTWHTMARLQQTTSAVKKVITASSEPGTLIISGMVTGTPTYNGQLSGHLSLNYNSTFSGNVEKDTACWLLNLTNQEGETSDTDGDIIATKGHITFKSGLNLPKVGNLVLKNNGRITVEDGVAVNPKADLHIRGAGTLELAAGVNLTVGCAWTYADDTTETATQLHAGKYARVADPSQGITKLASILGDGVLTVTKPSGLLLSVQ